VTEPVKPTCYRVMVKNQWLDFHAESYVMEKDGRLILWRDGLVVALFASGQWVCIARVWNT